MNEKKVYFSAWVDCKIKVNDNWHYVIQEPDWGYDEVDSYSPARNDQDDKFQLVFEKGYQAYLYFIEAEDTKAAPRTIKNIRTSFVFAAEISRMKNGDIIAFPTKRIELE